MFSKKSFITAVLIIISTLPLYSRGEKGIGVVKGSFDPIDKVLSTYRIDYSVLKYEDLQNLETMKKYRLIFFPCGLKPPLHEHITMTSRGRNVQSVTLKKNISRISGTKIAKNIQTFVEEGGSAYFSGYAASLLQDAFGPFTYFDDFPHMGLPGRFVARLRGEMAHFNLKNEMALYMTHTGWITIKKARNAAVLADALYETARGTREGPVAFLMNRGDGEIIYTSYHSTVFSDFRRFNIYRLTGNHLVTLLKEEISRWEQEKISLLADSFHQGEAVRTYRIPLRTGMNTIYLMAEKHPFQVDILDRDSRLMVSVNNHKRYEEIDIPSRQDDYCILRIYPDTKARHFLHAIGVARGKRILPHLTIVLIATGSVAALLLFLFIRFIMDRSKYLPPGFR